MGTEHLPVGGQLALDLERVLVHAEPVAVETAGMPRYPALQFVPVGVGLPVVAEGGEPDAVAGETRLQRGQPAFGPTRQVVIVVLELAQIDGEDGDRGGG